MVTPDIREKAERITQAELVAKFGDFMPNDAAEILINTDTSVPISEVRQRLSASAARWKVRKRVVALWEETVENSAHLWAGDTARDLLVEADGQPERYDVFASMVADAFQAALLEAHKAGREEAAKLIEEGYERKVAKAYRDDGVRSKNDQCDHGRYMYEDCEACAATAIRSIK